MVPRILYLHPKTYKQLIRLRKQAERDGAYRVAKRLQAVVLNSEGRTSGELAHLITTLEPTGMWKPPISSSVMERRSITQMGGYKRIAS